MRVLGGPYGPEPHNGLLCRPDPIPHSLTFLERFSYIKNDIYPGEIMRISRVFHREMKLNDALIPSCAARSKNCGPMWTTTDNSSGGSGWPDNFKEMPDEATSASSDLGKGLRFMSSKRCAGLNTHVDLTKFWSYPVDYEGI